MCNDRSSFSVYQEEEDGNSVLMGNHNALKVHGKGSVELHFTFGKKITLMNVFYVPEIRKNLVFVNLLLRVV